MTTLEFTAVRASVAQAVKQAERARQLRIESIDRQLPVLESDITTKQQEVAALRAERERLQAQTGHDLVAEMLGPLEYRKVKDIPQALFDAHDGVWLDEAGDRVADMKPERRIRPRGTTFGALQAKAGMAGDGGEKRGEQLYYLQDARQFVGNCLLFWRANGAGYTTEIADAGKYTADEILKLNPRDTDKIWPVSVVDAAVCGHVRTDTGKLSSAQSVALADLKNQSKDEPFIPGLPDKRLRDVWAEWEDNDGDVVTFKGERYRYSSWPSSDADQLIGDGSEWSSQYPLRPRGATWEHVKRRADAAEKKESGPLKVGDRVEVPEGVRDLVHKGAIPTGQYEVTRNWEDGIIRIQRGSVRYLVRDSDVRRAVKVGDEIVVDALVMAKGIISLNGSAVPDGQYRVSNIDGESCYIVGTNAGYLVRTKELRRAL